MNDDITIVTAFYDIGRGDIKGAERDYNKYIEYFSFWAGLKNRLVIYTSDKFKDKILAVRENLGLKDKTTLIIKELESFDKEALQKMREILAKYNQSKGRKHPLNIECVSAEYDYVMYCKPFFVCDAIERGLTSDKVLWLDFGFNHGGEFFTNKNEFNFTLQTQDYANFNEKCMNFFALKDKEKAHLAEIYYSMEVYLIGTSMYGDAKAWQHFKRHFEEALRAFLSFQIIDDDQVLLLWCVRNYPRYYHLIRNEGEWFNFLSFFIPNEIRQKLSVKGVVQKPYKILKAKMKQNFKEKRYFKAFWCALKYVLTKFKLYSQSI